MLTVNFQNTDILNDPQGILFHYNKQQIKPLDVNIATSQPICKQCKNGYGINQNGTCSPCLEPCAECVFVSEKYQYCLKCQNIYRLNEENICVKLSIKELPCKRG